MLRPVLLAIARAAMPAAAQAPAKPGAPDVSRVRAGTYKVDPGHTQVFFSVDHMGISDYAGQFVQPTGTLTIDPRNPAAARVEIVFPIDKVSTTDPRLDAHLKGADFFDAAKHPEGRFVSTRVAVNGTRATIAGNLTLKGVTKPVTLSARFYGAGTNPMSKKVNVGFEATATIRRSDFGISYGIPIVGDEVKLMINAAFEAQ